MRLMFLSVLLSFGTPFTRGYLIDDRDSAITYFPTWERFSNSDAYKGTTTDNACLTDQGCRFRFSFTGSGVTLTRYIITDIPIPLNATVTVDGTARPQISVADGSSAVNVYDLQSLNDGVHSMEVTLVSYNGQRSHFRLDSVTVNETAPSSPPPPTPPISTPPVTPNPSTTTPQQISSPPLGNVPSKKMPVAAIAGGAVGALVVVGLTAWLLLRVRQRRQLNQNLVKEPVLDPSYPPFAAQATTETNWPHSSTTPFDAPPTALPATRFASTAIPATLAGATQLPPAPRDGGQYLSNERPDVLPAVAANRPRRLKVSPFATPPPTATSPAAIMPDTDFTSTSNAAALAHSSAPTEAADGSQYASHPSQDFDPLTLTDTPPSSPPARSISPSAPSAPRGTTYLNDDQVEFVANLYRQRVPAPDVARIVETLLTEEAPPAPAEASNSGAMAGDRQLGSPPAYDFKAAS